MLRRKLMLRLGSVVALLVACALGAIILLQSMLADLGQVNLTAERHASAATRFSETLTAIATEVNRRILTSDREQTINLSEAVAVLSEQAERMVDAFDVPSPELDDLRPLLDSPMANLAELANRVGTSLPSAERGAQQASMLNQTVVLREWLGQFNRVTRSRTLNEHERLVGRFRVTVIVLGILFLVLINVSLGVLLHASAMILRPLGALTDASRRLGRGEFDHRIELPGGDEFGELAASYNQLAQELQSTEARRLETLHQVARTLNHELNNAISIIELQLRKLEAPTTDAAPSLRHIHETLNRITQTVEALKRVRRIVLTDYVEGVKMLDLERSVEEAPLIETPRGEATPEIHAS